MSRRLILIIPALMIMVAGCGYSFLGSQADRPMYGGINSIHVPMVENATTNTRLTNSLTNDIIEEFLRTKTFDVASPDKADAVLTVSIKSIQKTSVAKAKSGDESSARRAIVEVAASLTRKSDNKIVWRASSIEGRRTYPVYAFQSNTEINLDSALQDISRNIANKIHNLVVEDF